MLTIIATGRLTVDIVMATPKYPSHRVIIKEEINVKPFDHRVVVRKGAFRTPVRQSTICFFIYVNARAGKKELIVIFHLFWFLR